MKTLLLFAALLSVAAALAPLYNMGLDTVVPDEYIVVLNRELNVEKRDAHLDRFVAAHPTVKVLHTYDIGKFIAFAAVLDKGALMRELEHEDVLFIEANQRVQLSADETVKQSPATWGLDRVDQRDLPLNNEYDFFQSGGYGVDAYVIDTGILCDHTEFVGRCRWGANFVDGEKDEDCNGHGTHVAGTIAGKTYGLAKFATLTAVKCLGCSGGGTWAGVIGAIDWVAKQHEKHKRSVANMSLGGGLSPSVDQAVNDATEAGVIFAVAAGNNNANACNYSPAAAKGSITVMATTNTDARASYSNWGNCSDIFAPGTNIMSAWIGSNTATSTISGTSMASPHVAGAIACWLGHLYHQNSTGDVPTPEEARAYLKETSTADKITSPGTGSPNRMLYSPSVEE